MYIVYYNYSMPIVTLRLADDEYQDLKRYANSRSMSTSELLRNALFFMRFMDRTKDLTAISSFIQNDIIQSVMQDVKASMEQRMQSKEFQAKLQENLPEIKREAERFAIEIQKIAPYRKRRGRPPKDPKLTLAPSQQPEGRVASDK